jgi:hypothetical protein
MVTFVGPPVAAVLLAASVITVVLPVVLNEGVTPLGNPDAVKVTAPVNPFCGVTVSVLVPLAPCTTVREVGEAERPKSGAAAGVRTYAGEGEVVKMLFGAVELPVAPPAPPAPSPIR